MMFSVTIDCQVNNDSLEKKGVQILVMDEERTEDEEELRILVVGFFIYIPR